MTSDFMEKMNKAMENAILDARKQDKEYLEKVEFNQQYADLYMELVIAFVEKFDFHTGKFHSDMISKDFLEKFGHPKDVFAWISEKDQQGKISLDYQVEGNYWGRAGEPEFKKCKGFDLKIINDILSKNGISIREDHLDAGGMGSENDYICFDASMLIEQRNKLSNEAPMNYRRI